MLELTTAEAQYVDQMAGTVISQLITGNPNAYNTEYFKVLGQTAYQLALVMLEVRNEKVTVVEKTFAEAIDNAITVVKDVASATALDQYKGTPVLAATVPVAETAPETGDLAEQIGKVGKVGKVKKVGIKEVTAVKAKNKGGRPKGTKNKKKTSAKEKKVKTKIKKKKNTKVEPLALS